MMKEREEEVMNKKKKGFTLIELIVVIAILGILAAIAIPRVAGFTDKAKIANDKELASIVAHALATEVSSGDIVIATDGNVQVTNSGNDLSYTPTANSMKNASGTVLDAAALKAILDPLVGTGKQFSYYNGTTSTKGATISFTVANSDFPVNSITYTK